MKNNYSKEDYEKAKSVSLVDYLSNSGYKLIHKGRHIYLQEHDSLCINADKNLWYWFSRGIGGNVIDFLVKYENKSIVDAVNILAGNNIYEKREFTRYEPVAVEKGEIVLPAKNSENKRAYSYLTKTRGIDSEIVNELIKQGFIYENDKGGVVFVSKDKENNVKFACVRSTSQNSSFKQDVKNSNKEYGFKTVGTSERVFVFEAPIDLLTHATISKIQGKDWRQDNRVSLGGVSDKALEQFLKDNQNIKEIVLFLDNDNVGIENAKKIAKKYGNDYKIKIFTSKEKDLNETLLSYNKHKEKDNNLNFTNFIKPIKNPFICPKLNSNSNLYDFLRNKLDLDVQDSTIDYFIKNNLLVETEDEKIVLLIKDEKGANIGGFEFDIDDKDFKPKLLKDSENRACVLECDKEFIYLTDNLHIFMFLNGLEIDTAFFDDLGNIKAIEDINLDKYKTIVIGVTNENLLKEFNNPNSSINETIKILENKYSIKIQVEDDIPLVNHYTGKKSLYEAYGIIEENTTQNPFIPPKFKEENTILNSFNDKIKDINLNYFLQNNLLEIGETADNKMVVLFKENDKVIQGGFEFDIVNLNFKAKLLDGSRENYIFLENIDKNCKDKTLVFTDNLLFYMHSKESIKDFHTALTDNLTLENILKIKENLPNIYEKIIFMHSELDTLKHFQNIPNLDKMLGVSKCFNENFVGMDSSFLKEQHKQSLNDKIRDKKEILEKDKQGKSMPAMTAKSIDKNNQIL